MRVTRKAHYHGRGPGMSKTRTAEELATYASLRQAQVLWGRCYEGEGVPPYWPWADVSRFYIRG